MDPKTKEKTLNVGFLNIHGQSKMTQSKQDQIQYLIKEHELDVLNLQETYIDESTFQKSPFIANNYKVIFKNNESGYGVCSLVRNELPTKNEIQHPSGRLIAFDIGELTMTNVYLPSGGGEARDQRENFFGQTIPNTLLSARRNGICGGDFNSITHPSDCTHNPEAKMSPNLKKLTRILSWQDTFRILHPQSQTFSHFYNRQMSGTGLTAAASRLDRAYLWGDLKTVKAEYVGAPFSDHMLFIVSLECPEAKVKEDKHFKPHYKIKPETAKDEAFQKRVEQTVKDWLPAKEKLPLLVWWDYLKKDIRQVAKQVNRERAKEKRETLNYLMLAQSHLAKKVSTGNLDLLPKLKYIQLQINEFFDKQAEKIKLHAKAQDMEESEKVRIYHYDQFHRCNNKKKISKLKTEEGIIEGHNKVAEFFKNEVEALFGKEVKLDEEAQEKLLDEVEEEFSEDDNKMLESEITDEEVKLSLKTSNKKASPGCDGITFLVYEECWSVLGPHLCEVVRQVIKEGTPSRSMQHSLLVFSPKPGKQDALLPKNFRRLSMLQSDWKLITGILAARLRKTEGHTMSKHQYAAGPKRITQAICRARDTVQSVSPNQKGCGILELDYMAGYDMLSLKWTWKTLLKKKCSPIFCETLKKLYELSPSFLICSINNQQQGRIQNKRCNIKQGDRASTTLYCFSTSPMLSYLQKRLQGILYHKLSTEGPEHPILGPPKPVEARLKAMGFVDDLKCGVSSVKEFGTVDGAVRLFERASGSRLHRDPNSKKCQFLGLGRWSRWTQSQCPLDYVAVVEELDFLGCILGKSNPKSRALNGEFLKKKVKNTIASFKAGRHMPLVCRPYAINTYILSKISYKSAIFNLRVQDINSINSMTKQYLTQDLLLKPPEALVYRDSDQGGLGLVHAGARAMANLLNCFIQQSHPRSRFPNLYLNSVYRCYVLGELSEDKVKKPPFYSNEFFQFINEARAEWGEDILAITTRGWQQRVLQKGITHQIQEDTGTFEVIRTKQEIRLPQANWISVWLLRRKRGLTQAQKSWLFKFSEGLHVNNERLCKIGKLSEGKCDHCEKEDTRTHIFKCAFNDEVADGFRQVLETASGSPVPEENLGICDFNLPQGLQLPVLFLMAEVGKHLQTSRSKNKRIQLEKMSAEIHASSSAFLKTKKYGFAHEMIQLWLKSFFQKNSNMDKDR